MEGNKKDVVDFATISGKNGAGTRIAPKYTVT
jgi:hypothetical protein